jgi:hypothetical protein
MMGRLVFVYALPPVVAPALVGWAVATRHLSNGLRRATLVLTIFLACGFWTLFRTEGIKGWRQPGHMALDQDGGRAAAGGSS